MAVFDQNIVYDLYESDLNLECFEVVRDYDGADSFSIVKTFSNPSCKGFDPFPLGTTFSNGEELLKLLLDKMPNRGIRRYYCKSCDFKGSKLVTVYMYLTKLVGGEYKEVEEVVSLHIPGDIRKEIKNINLVENVYFNINDEELINDYQQKHLEKIEEKVKENNEVQELVRRVLVEYNLDDEIDLEGLLTSEEFKYILLSDPKLYKSIINFDNKSLGYKYGTITTLSILSLYITAVSGSCIFDNNNGKAKVLLALLASIPVLANLVLVLKRRIDVNKIYNEALENDNKTGVRRRKNQA